MSKVRELLENPRPAEKWFSRDAFDPMHGKTELRNAHRRGFIELDTSDDDNWRFRFTAGGRDRLEAGTIS